MKRSLGAILLAYPMPAFLVGSYDAKGKANIMTAAWGGICCSTPPCVAVSIRPARTTYKAVLDRKAFTISVPSCRLAAQVDYAGLVPGKNIDKFAVAGLTATRSELVDAPYVDECPVVLECKLLHTLELGSHTQFVGVIEDVKVDEACLTPEGVPDVDSIDPLVFNSGQGMYHSLGAPVGQAFSIGKSVKHGM